MKSPQAGSEQSPEDYCEPDVGQEFWNKWGWLSAGIWIIFLVFPVLDLIQGDYPTATRILGILLVVAFGGLYVRAYATYNRVVGEGGTREWRALAYFAVLWAIVLLGVAVLGVTAIGMFPFLTSYAAFLLGKRITIVTYGVVTVLCFALPIALRQFADSIFLIGLNLVLMIFYAVMVQAITRSSAAEKMRAEFLMVAEQERVARDVHDGIGHSLTALNLKAQLALRLLDAGQYQQARGELEQLSALAVDALDSVRTTVHGLSRQDLHAELQELRRACADSSLRVTVTGVVEDIPLPWRSHVAWILREAVTNVLRHAHAENVAISLGPHGVSVDDDGDGMQGGMPGHGLRGMQERARQFGAACTVGASRLGGTSVKVSFGEGGVRG